MTAVMVMFSAFSTRLCGTVLALHVSGLGSSVPCLILLSSSSSFNTQYTNHSWTESAWLDERLQEAIGKIWNQSNWPTTNKVQFWSFQHVVWVFLLCSTLFIVLQVINTRSNKQQRLDYSVYTLTSRSSQPANIRQIHSTNKLDLFRSRAWQTESS